MVARKYDNSLRTVSRLQECELVPLDQWNCCGAMSLPTANYLLSLALPARNLALAEEKGLPLLVACGTCLKTLRRSRHAFLQRPAWRSRVQEVLGRAGRTYSGEADVRHVLEVLAEPLMLARLRRQVINPLSGERVAVYYGCQLGGAANLGLSTPSHMEDLLAAVGAEILPYDQKTRCCGNSLAGTSPEEAFSIARALLNEALMRGAHSLVVACPLCHHNLVQAQQSMGNGLIRHRLRVAYFSERLAEALGVEET